MTHNGNWDDLRFLLAVAEAGSVNAAARRLSVNHATVLRRIAGLEARLGLQLFDRSTQGYTLRPGNAALMAALHELEAAATSLDRVLAGNAARLSGAVRITSTDTFCTAVLPALVAEVSRREPDLSLELLSTNTQLDLARMDAEVAVRPSPVLPEGLDGTSPARLGFTVAVHHGWDASAPWIGVKGPIAGSVPGVWLAQQLAETAERPRMTVDSFLVLRDMVAAGMGKALLPACLVGSTPGLKTLHDCAPPMSVPIWVACHADLAHVPRINAVRRALERGLAARRDWLERGV